MTTKAESCVKLRGRYYIEHWRAGKLLKTYRTPNGIVNIGKDTILNVMFNDGTAKLIDWAIGFIDLAGFTALADADTMATHTGWVEFTGYSEATRPEWDPVVASSQSITNSTLRDFNITSSGTIKGVFVVDNDTKSGTAGTLFATALFAGDIPVAISDVIKIQYTVAA